MSAHDHSNSIDERVERKLRTRLHEASQLNTGTLSIFRKKNKKENEILRHFWHALTGMVAKCEFKDQTVSLKMDAFIQNKNSKSVEKGSALNQ